MANFSFQRNYPFDEEIQFNVLVSESENWSEQRRVISANPRRIFTCNFYPLTKTEIDLIKAFYVARVGIYEAFDFDNPLDGIRYSVRFVDKSFKSSRVAFNTYKASVMLMTLRVQTTISLFVTDLVDILEWVQCLDSINVNDLAAATESVTLQVV